MRKKGMVWFSLLLLLISFLPNFFQAYIAYAQSPEEVKQTIIQSDYLNVSTTSRQVNNELLWEIDYSIGVPAENHARRIKIKVFNQDERDVIQPEQLFGWVTSEDNWFQTEALSQTGKGTVTIRTALDVSALNLKVQVDEEVTNDIEVAGETPEATTTSQEKVLTENILVAPFADSHTLSAPIVQASTDTTTSSTTVETSPVETTEVDSSVTEAETSEESTSTTESSKTESSPSESNKGNTKTASSENEQARNVAPVYGPMIMPFSANPYVDGFDYTTNTDGTFPTQFIDRYLPDINNSQNIRNFNYLQVVTGRTPANSHAGQASPKNQVVNYKNSNSFASILDASGNVKSGLTATPWHNFGDGYVGYWESSDLTGLQTDLEKFSKLILNKKTVKATSDPTKFDVELDLIGGVTVKPDRLVDIVFVIDKSTSMTENVPGSTKSRWTVLKEAMTKFSNTLLTAENAVGDSGNGFIRMGLAAFGSSSSSSHYGDIGHFGSIGNGNYTGFTKSASSINGHSIMTTNIGNTSYTPTFLGLDAGLEMLRDDSSYGVRSNAEKVVIILTDGLPTRGPSDTYNNNSNAFRALTTQSNQGNTTVRRYTADSNAVTGNSSTPTTDLNNRTINHANARSTSYPAIDRYSVGFGISGTDVTNVLKALGPKMQGLATDSDSLDYILSVFSNAIGPKVPYVNNATINDPMSPYVTLDTTSVQLTPLTLNLASGGNTLVEPGGTPPYIASVIKNVTNSGIQLDKVTLSGTADANRVNNVKDGLRLKYTVTLKPEYQDGKFYQTNGPTYLDQANYAYSLGFTVPSVRYRADKRKEKVKIPVRKIWQKADGSVDTSNELETQKAVTFQLQETTDDPSLPTANWTNVAGKTITLPVGTVTGEFLDMPTTKLVSSVTKTVYYRVTEARVAGYSAPTYTPSYVGISDKDDESTATSELKVTNKLLVKDIVFKKTKADGTTALAGVQFTIRKDGANTPILQTVTSTSTGEVKFTNLPISDYLVEEVSPPENYKPIAPIKVKVIDTNAVLSVTGLPTDNIVKNHLKDISLVVTKQDNRGQALNGAIFELKKGSETITPSTAGNIFTFNGLIPGTYTLRETSPPNGYVGIADITIVVGENGQVTVTGNDSNVNKTDPNKNIIELTIKNTRKGQLPSTGGQGMQQYLLVTLILASIAGVIGIYYVYRNRKGAE